MTQRKKTAEEIKANYDKFIAELQAKITNAKRDGGLI